MKIKNYDPDALRFAQETLNANEEHLMSSNGRKGSEGNPYSLMEMCDMVKEGNWRGGYVDIVGTVTYVGRDDYRYGGDSSNDYTIYANDDIEFSNVSFLLPSGVELPSPTSDSSSSDKKTNIEVSSDRVEVRGITYIVEKVLCEGCVVIKIKLGVSCNESAIPTIIATVSYEGSTAQATLHKPSNDGSFLRENTLIGTFGYRQKEGQVVDIELINSDHKKDYLPVAFL